MKALELAIPGLCIRSRSFRDESMPDISWQLCLYPAGKREENVGNVSLFLKMSTMQTNREFTVRAEYRFYFLDDDNQPRFSNVNTGDFKVKPSKSSHSWGLRNIPRAKVVNCIREDHSLHIVCQIELVPDFNKVQTHLLSKRDKKCDVASLTKDYLSQIHEMYVSGEGADCVIECEPREFHVHKFVLIAHSAVFRAMFKHKETLENMESRVKLVDTDPTAVQHMLTYLYSGSLPDGLEDQDAPPLMSIAEKYGLDPLKLLCQDKLISRLTVANVCSMLEMSYLYNAELIMEACIPIVKAYVHDLMKGHEWLELKASNPNLINTVLEKVVTLDQSAPPPQKRIRLLDMQSIYRQS
jgi:speckle-type POZ protein